MLEALTSRWWVFLVRGIAAVVFAVAAVFWPGITLLALTILFGAYAFIDGTFAIAAALSGYTGSRWWLFVLEGLVGLVVAFFVLTQPGLSILALVYTIGAWAVFTGVIEIMAGLQLRDVISNEWLYVLGGIVSIAFGILVIRNPQAGALAVVWMVAFYALLFGIVQIVFGYRLNQMRSAAQHAHAA